MSIFIIQSNNKTILSKKKIHVRLEEQLSSIIIEVIE